MKKKLLYSIISFFIAGISLSLYACDDGVEEEEPAKPKELTPSYNIPSAEGITDLVLIYHGFDERPLLNQEDLQPFIYRKAIDSKVE